MIFFFLLPLFAVAVGALHSEKSLQADTRSLLPDGWTLDNFRVILSGGTAGFSQVTYLPDNVKKIYFALANSAIIAVSVTAITLLFAALSAYTVARLRARWMGWFMTVNVFVRFVPIIVLMIPLYVIFRGLGLLNSVWGVIIAETGFLLPLRPFVAFLGRARIAALGGVLVAAFHGLSARRLVEPVFFLAFIPFIHLRRGANRLSLSLHLLRRLPLRALLRGLRFGNRFRLGFGLRISGRGPEKGGDAENR